MISFCNLIGTTRFRCQKLTAFLTMLPESLFLSFLCFVRREPGAEPPPSTTCCMLPPPCHVAAFTCLCKIQNCYQLMGCLGEFLRVMYKSRVHCLITKNSQYNKLQLVLGYRECAVVQCNHLGRCSVLNRPITNSAEAFGFLSCTLVFVWAIAVHCCKM